MQRVSHSVSVTARSMCLENRPLPNEPCHSGRALKKELGISVHSPLRYISSVRDTEEKYSQDGYVQLLCSYGEPRVTATWKWM